MCPQYSHLQTFLSSLEVGSLQSPRSFPQKKTTTAAKSGVELTAAEKKLVELYRAADADTKKKAVSVLKGEATDGGDLLSTLLGSAIDMFGKK